MYKTISKHFPISITINDIEYRYVPDVMTKVITGEHTLKTGEGVKVRDEFIEEYFQYKHGWKSTVRFHPHMLYLIQFFADKNPEFNYNYDTIWSVDEVNDYMHIKTQDDFDAWKILYKFGPKRKVKINRGKVTYSPACIKCFCDSSVSKTANLLINFPRIIDMGAILNPFYGGISDYFTGENCITPTGLLLAFELGDERAADILEKIYQDTKFTVITAATLWIVLRKWGRKPDWKRMKWKSSLDAWAELGDFFLR